MNESFKIIKIDEPDFGCEGIPDGEPLRDEVTIEDNSGKQFLMRIEDKLLYDKDLNEGDRFYINENGEPEKVL